MKKLFDKRFVYFMWDDELTDKECFVAGNIYDLMHNVDVNDKKYKYRIKPEQSKLMTRRQLAEWLAKGNGEVTWGANVMCYSTLDYDDSKKRF